MSGEVIFLQDDASGRIGAFVTTLARLPAEPRWVLIGGLAVNVRIGRVHRATNDVDAITEDQPKLVEILVASDAERLSASKIRFVDPPVEVDLMESTEGTELPPGESDRVFAVARRWTMRTASSLRLGVVDASNEVVAKVDLAVASPAALVALKAVSIPRRAAGSYPHKVGSDIQDLLSLLNGQDLDALIDEFSSLDKEATRWIADTLTKGFSRGTSDLRYSFARLRRLAANTDARSITEDDLVLIGEFGLALSTSM